MKNREICSVSLTHSTVESILCCTMLSFFCFSELVSLHQTCYTDLEFHVQTYLQTEKCTIILMETSGCELKLIKKGFGTEQVNTKKSRRGTERRRSLKMYYNSLSSSTAALRLLLRMSLNKVLCLFTMQGAILMLILYLYYR